MLRNLRIFRVCKFMVFPTWLQGQGSLSSAAFRDSCRGYLNYYWVELCGNGNHKLKTWCINSAALVEENYYLFIAFYYSSDILFKYPWLLLKTEPSPSYPLLMSGVWASSDYGHNIKMIKSEPSQYSFLRKENSDWGGMSTVRRRSHLYHKPHFFILWPRLRLRHLVNGPFVALSLVEPLLKGLVETQHTHRHVNDHK